MDNVEQILGAIEYPKLVKIDIDCRVYYFGEVRVFIYSEILANLNAAVIRLEEKDIVTPKYTYSQLIKNQEEISRIIDYSGALLEPQLRVKLYRLLNSLKYLGIINLED
ncbi:MAG: hypothetical protein AB4372_24200 [Xenococcus sp. (in: cyanobacteria)]